MPRSLRAVSLAALVFHVPAIALGQDAEWRIQDCDMARAALGEELFGNLTVSQAGISTRCRFHATYSMFDAVCADGTLHRIDTSHSEDDFAWILLAIALSTGELNLTMGWAGVQLPQTLQGFMTLPGPSGPTLVQLVGTQQTGLTLQADTSQLRQIRVARGSDDWLLTVHDFSSLGNGWYPGTVVLAANGASVMSVTIDDIAADEASLSPLQSIMAGPTPLGAVHFPRLPL
jgi:hypothetical protein